MNIDEIVTKAIPAEDCPIKNANAMHRRVELRKRIVDLVNEKISVVNPKAGINDDGAVFIAGPFGPKLNNPFHPDLEYKEKDITG